MGTRINLADAKARLSEIVDRVEAGESIDIIRRRKLAARIDRRAAALAAWSRLRAESLLTLAVLDEHFEAAAHIASRRTLGIRSGDALHLAIAAEGGHRLVTFDRAMAAAAPHIGVPVEPL